jgi:hypothetical protein
MSLTAGSMQRELRGSGSAITIHSARHEPNSTKIRYALADNQQRPRALARRVVEPGLGRAAWGGRGALQGNTGASDPLRDALRGYHHRLTWLGHDGRVHV